jgi:neutral amino acid transport system ATP-binding protein
VTEATETTEGRALLDVDGVVKRFGGIHAVDGASFGVAEGSVTALIGPNGAGKTTLFNVVTGFHRGDRGSVRFAGDEVLRMPAYAIARRGMVRTFQITKALAAMPVIDNMMLAAPDQPGERFRNLVLHPGMVRRREREVHEQAVELLDVFGLSKLADDYAGTLSGGQRKLLELARALMVRPVMILLDEPMAGVNPALTQSLLGHVTALRDEGMTVCFVEHDMDVVMGISDWVAVMAGGKLVAEGPPYTIGRNRAVVDAYLGKRHDEPEATGEEA